jgi:hypothetical protein
LAGLQQLEQREHAAGGCAHELILTAWCAI